MPHLYDTQALRNLQFLKAPVKDFILMTLY